jgi:hypothetical protein
MTETALITPRRNFLIRALGFTQPALRSPFLSSPSTRQRLVSCTTYTVPKQLCASFIQLGRYGCRATGLLGITGILRSLWPIPSEAAAPMPAR